MKGLETVIKDEEARRKHILTEMIYMVELDKKNVFMMKKIFCGGKYKLNIINGSFIDFKDFKAVKIDMKFDIILGNLPFQYKENDKQAQPIWHLFIERSYTYLLKDNGYLLFLHPSGWRDISGIYRHIFNYIKEHNLIYLSMNDYKEGKRVFGGAGTNFDYYLVQNTKTATNITEISDIDNDNIDNKNYEKDLNQWDFIPSGKIKLVEKLLTKTKKVDILYDRTMYGIDKNNMNKLKTDNYNYPCVYTITQKDGASYWYSNENKGHFGIPKVIWSNGSGTYPIIDKKGKYGLTQYSYAIIDDKDNLKQIKDAMNSEKFIDLMKYLTFKEDNKYNYKIIGLFKKDFYKYFFT
jgi:hypothetical protein